MGQTDFIENDQREGDGNGGEQRCNDGRFLCVVVTAFILVAGEHNAEGTVADPGGNAVNGCTAGYFEHRAHELGQQSADKFKQTEVGQQREQIARHQENEHKTDDQVIGHRALVCADDRLNGSAFGRNTDEGIAVEPGQPNADAADHADDHPHGRAGKAALEQCVVHDELGFCKRDQRHDGGDRQNCETEDRNVVVADGVL